MALNYVTVTGTFDDGSGSPIPATGQQAYCQFTPSTQVYASGVPLITPAQPIQASIHNGTMSVQLLATDNAGLTFGGLTGFFFWTVTLVLNGQAQPSWSFFLPHTPSPVDLSALANTAAGTAGFQNPMTTLGDLIYENGTPAAARLAGDVSNTRKFLRTQASGGVAQAPAWDTIQAGDVPTLNQNTTGTAANVTGIVAIPNGGTGQASQQAALDALAGAATANQVLAGNGTHVTLRALATADLPSNGGIPLAWMPSVVITTTGAAFAPFIALANGSTATVYFVYNGAVAALGPGPAAAPGVANAGAGGTVAAGTYQVVVTYVTASGETIASASASTTTSGTTSTITVTSPPSAANVTGYYVYCTQAGGSTYTRQQAPGSPTAIGTNYTLTAPPTSSGANPPMTFGTTATRSVRMFVTDASGYNALDQVIVFNIGYNNTLDNGPWSPSSAFNWPAQAVSGVTNIRAMTALQYFLAEQVTGLAGTLDFTGMSQLTVADMYGSTALSGVNLAGCASLQRLSVELCSLTRLDLNPVAASLRDIRCALQTGGSLAFEPLAAPLIKLWHFCDQTNQTTVTTLMSSTPNLIQNQADAPAGEAPMPAPAVDTIMPSIGQLWIWSNNQYGALSSSSPYLNSVDAHSNWYSSADFSSAFRVGLQGGACSIDMSHNQLTSVNLTGCAALGGITLNHNPLSQAAVDSILAQADAFGTSNKTLDLSNTAAPSATGTTHKTNLTGRGWTVTTDASGANGGGFGNKFTYGESVIVRFRDATTPFRAKLSQPVNSGDLLIAMIESPGAPSISDSSGNTWTIVGPLQSFGYLAYCLSAAASSTGLTVSTTTNTVGLAVSRFVPHGVVSFGASASAGGVGAGGYPQNAAYNMGNLGTVPADALAWGCFVTDNQGGQTFTPNFQSGNAGTPDFLGAAWQDSVACPQGAAVIAYVPGCANANASLTWNGSGTGGSGFAVSAYFTSL